MKRQLLNQLLAWKASPVRKPLLLEGARQVGKTYLLKEEFGAKYYRNVVYLNLQNPLPEIAAIFQETINPKTLINQLKLLLHTNIDPGETLIIFDEVQEIPRALTSLKYFYEEAPEYHIAVAGSLLGIFLHQEASFPVGKVDTLKLEPLSFREFLWATGEADLAQHLEENPTDMFFQPSLTEKFREYLFVGGMPEAVQSWVTEHDVEKVDEIQERILLGYTSDFSKYPNASTALRIRQVYDSIPGQFAKHNEKFLYGVIKEGARAREYELAIEWLVNAGIVRRVYQIERGDKLPLKAYINHQNFKLYFLDSGLLRKLCDLPSSVVVQSDAIFNEFNGALAEQFVLQQLNSDDTLYYWTSGANAEVDFVMQDQAQIIPIEVKSGTNVQAKSLKVYREKYRPPLAIRFSLKKFEYNSGLLNIPLTHIFLTKQLITLSQELSQEESSKNV